MAITIASLLKHTIFIVLKWIWSACERFHFADEHVPAAPSVKRCGLVEKIQRVVFASAIRYSSAHNARTSKQGQRKLGPELVPIT
jgi:hypothetical protein